MSRAFELTVTPFLFGFVGYLLDGRFGTRPVLTLLLGVWGLIGVGIKLWLTYAHEMRQQEEALAARRLPRTGAFLARGGSQ